MSDPMEEIRASFFVECEELLESLQDALESLSDGADDVETINVAFRAVHSIKGGAGAFGLDDLVAFAHMFETAMDAARDGRLEVGADVVAIFFRAADSLADLVRAARDGETLDGGTIPALLSELDALVDGAGGDNAAGDEGELGFEPMTLSLDLPDLGEPEADVAAGGGPGSADGNRVVSIRFVPAPELYALGNEPLFLLSALGDLGKAEIRCSAGDLPDLGDYGPATSVLAWDIRLETEADDDALREVFDFVDGLCTLDITEAGGGDGTLGDADTVAAPELPADASPEPDAVPEPAPEPVAQSDPPDPTEAETTGDGPATSKADGKPETGREGPAQAAAPAALETSGPAPTVRVDLDRIDRLVNLVGELVINQSMLAQSVAATGLSGNGAIAAGLDEFQQLTRSIQDSVMMIRAQPVKSLFQRMGRIVREASAATEKSVRFKTEGEATEIDKTMIERLADPLTHMIRNAVDHGLEDGEARTAAEKPAEGTVTLTAAHRSGRVVIELSDDGGGINREKVQSVAERKGLIPPGQDLSDTEIDNLLFLPGFSTAGTVSNLSGRGVGMDVVKTAITGLGGRVAIRSTPGAGTTFTISLPLTLAVLDGMVVKIRDETIVVPLSAMSETLSLGPDDARALGSNSHVLQVRDEFVPLIDLGAELGYGPRRDGYEGAIVLLISQEDGARAALIVDGIDDQRQVVIKGLEGSYGHVPGIAAATILGDGQVALILDPTDLMASAAGANRAKMALTGTE